MQQQHPAQVNTSSRKSLIDTEVKIHPAMCRQIHWGLLSLSMENEASYDKGEGHPLDAYKTWINLSCLIPFELNLAQCYPLDVLV